jgi:hypothetical protein
MAVEAADALKEDVHRAEVGEEEVDVEVEALLNGLGADRDATARGPLLPKAASIDGLGRSRSGRREFPGLEVHRTLRHLCGVASLTTGRASGEATSPPRFRVIRADGKATESAAGRRT